MSALVWFAEDDAEMRSFVEQSLQEAGFEVESFCDGGALFAQARALAHGARRPAMIVTDHHMPVRLGLDVAEYLRAVDRTIPIVLITGFAEQEVHAKAQALGVRRVLDKPFDVEELIRCAEQLCG